MHLCSVLLQPDPPVFTVLKESSIPDLRPSFKRRMGLCEWEDFRLLNAKIPFLAICLDLSVLLILELKKTGQDYLTKHLCIFGLVDSLTCSLCNTNMYCDHLGCCSGLGDIAAANSVKNQ
ncbi:hypothetical protein TNCV_3811881 [Trichonephila clavipes]|nr:hypothetical protein TNCV_3811881 [Trichonephila clavipes]